MFLSALIYNLGVDINASGNSIIDVIRNPTAGDIVTNANAVDMNSNQNYGSNKTLDANAYKGAQGESVVTDGAQSIQSIIANGTGRVVISLGALVLPQGSSLAVNYTPRPGNTGQTINVAAACFLQSLEQ